MLGVSLDLGSIGDIARDDQKTVVYCGLVAIILAIIGTAIATVANAVWNKPPGSESIRGYRIDEIESHVTKQIDRKNWALIASVLAVALAIFMAGWAIQTAALAETAPITEGNRLMSVGEGEAKSTLCAGLEISDEGQVLFRAAGSAEATPVADMEKVTKTGDCDAGE